MAKAIHLRGVIRNLDYDPLVHSSALKTEKYEGFDINSAPSSGIIEFADGTTLAASKWLTPKPSRSYPSARIYRTYHLPKPITVIPLIKDEGSGTLNNDRIMFMTLSRMNLMNVYILLSWYESAKPHASLPNRITEQRLNNAFVRERILEVKRYKSTALHWNCMHFKRDFENVFRNAVECYQRIGKRYNVVMNSAENHLKILEKYLVNGEFSIDAFRESSVPRSASAARRESMTTHELEHLADGGKATFELKNYLGGIYHVTADEVYWENDTLIIQESKNSGRGRLPSLTDIQDGLFKNILFYNVDELYLGDNQIKFMTRLKLTGNVKDTLKLPDDDLTAIARFADRNELRPAKRELIELLHKETAANPGLSIEIAPNS